MDSQAIVDSIIERRMATVPLWFLYCAVGLGVATVGVLVWIATIGIEMKVMQSNTALILVTLTEDAKNADMHLRDHENRIVRLETSYDVKESNKARN